MSKRTKIHERPKYRGNVSVLTEHPLCTWLGTSRATFSTVFLECEHLTNKLKQKLNGKSSKGTSALLPKKAGHTDDSPLWIS